MARKYTSPVGGNIYLIHCQGTTYYKIGVCKSSNKKDIQQRIGSLQIGCPYELVYVCIVWYNSYVAQHEVNLHNKYWKNRIRGEWFTFAPDDVAKVVEEISNTTYSVKRRHKT